MAVAGLPNVPILESTTHRESLSSSSRRHGNRRSISTQASSILQMWRELEDECMVNRARDRGRPRLHREDNDGLSSQREGTIRGGLENLSESENGSVINFEGQMGHLNEQEDRQSLTSEQSQDQVGSRGDQVAAIASQIEQVCNGQVINHNEGQLGNNRRQIRKLCGRQALIDLMAKKEQERREELQCLEGTRPVSGFAHRTRIQSLLRLRCFQNRRRSTELRRPSSAAESELGLLRQRQTVSGLREGFMSRLDNNAHVQASDVSDGSSDNDSDAFRDDRSQANCSSEVLGAAQEQNEPASEVLNVSHQENEPRADVDVDVAPSTTPPSVDPGVSPSTDLDHPVDHGSMVQDLVDQSSNQTICIGTDFVRELGPQGTLDLNTVAFYELEPVSRIELNAAPCYTVTESVSEATSSQRLNTHVEIRLECDTNDIVESGPEMATSVHSSGSSNDGFREMNSQESPRGSSQFTVLEGRHEIVHEDYSGGEEANVHNALDDQVDISENLNVHELDVPEEDWQEQVSVYEREWESSPFSNLWRDDQVETDRLHWPGDGEDQSHAALENEGEQIDQDDYWHENRSQETSRDWLGLASGSRLASDRVDTYYFSDDDNVHHIELRELVNRRRVSSLLHSDFRESLDQLIQSYVERQTNAPDNWEIHEMLPPFVSRNQGRLHIELEEFGPDEPRANGSEPTLPPRPPPLPQAHWGQGMHQTNWARREIHQQSGTKWEIINDLRIDMARLHQRMNNMQRMLEACMDMQVELQRSVRQEVSAALNRSVNPSELLENILPKDSFKWDRVRKGVCCICSNTNIDSLLYRCGHMCTCTKCANVLVQGNGKCPMCQAPVVEVIRAYFIQ